VPLKKFVRPPEKPFSTVSVKSGHAACDLRCPLYPQRWGNRPARYGWGRAQYVTRDAPPEGRARRAAPSPPKPSQSIVTMRRPLDGANGSRSGSAPRCRRARRHRGADGFPSPGFGDFWAKTGPGERRGKRRQGWDSGCICRLSGFHPQNLKGESAVIQQN
jgi:hypothetical protein